MPVSADRERELQNHYKISDLYPNAWPHSADADDDDDDLSDEDGGQNGGPVRQPSKNSNRQSKYQTLNRHASIRSAELGPDSLVQKDEPDPLGAAPSVAAELRKRGLPVDDTALRNKFLLSSTSFSPALFLSQVHQDASTEDLLRGLDYLGKSIEQKSASLKVLVESNFEKFVKAKATIDNVYAEMRTQGQEEPVSPRPSSGRPGGHSRGFSRSQPSSHFRTASGSTFSPTTAKSPGSAGLSDKRKNALTKESDYGTLGLRTPLQDLTIKAEEVWGPALGGREKEENVKMVLNALEVHKDIFKLPAAIHEAVLKQDFDTVVASWKSAQRFADQARSIADRAQQRGKHVADKEAQQILVTAKMWTDVSQQIENYKKDVWKRLKTSHGVKSPAVADETDKEEHLELIGVLLQLGVDENPIWEWLHSRHQYLRDRIARAFERSRIEIEILRRRLAANDKQDTRLLARYLRSASSGSFGARSKVASRDMDASSVIHFWETVTASLSHLLSPTRGILGEVLDFWTVAQSFIDGKVQKTFPSSVVGSPSAQEHLELDPEEVQNLRAGAQELVDLLRESTLAFFADSPPDDISELYSPIPPTPITPDSAATGALSPSQERKRMFTFDLTNLPPPSAKRGDSWEKFAFWPPFSNTLSGSHYLARVIALVGTAAAELSSLSVVKQSRTGSENLKTMLGSVRERIVQALCASWTADTERFKYAETWQRSPERRDLTSMPTVFIAFEEKILTNFQRVAYVAEASDATEDVVVPPPSKLLQAIRGSFVTSIYKVLSGMVENAERNKPRAGSFEQEDFDGAVVNAAMAGPGDENSMIDGAIDARNRNIRLLLTLSNISHLRSDIIPHLISNFETAFSVKLTSESQTVRDVLGQIDARLFQSYVKPTVDKLDRVVQDGISDPSWAPISGRPDDARPYVYEVLLTLVLVHSEVSTTASSLTSQVLSHLLTSTSSSLLNAFTHTHPHYTLAALMQATLDVEFLAQTLNNYTTDKAGEIQSQIYLCLDERTDDEARKRLQGELPEMRGVLKRLREGTKGEFGCFRRERRGRAETGKGREGPAGAK
ncbi:exocyst complex protein [Hortaea werneckii]|nr:exocyst complex protein [Hortaea werneckii]